VSGGLGTQLGRGQGESRTARAAVRSAGRVALWVVLGLLFLRGIGSAVSGPGSSEPAARAQGARVDPATSSFAVRFARAYLSGSSPQELAPLLAPGVPTPGAGPSGVSVDQAEVAGIEALDGGQAIITVACELGDARTLYLAVPIVRASADEVAASGAPAVVAGPAGVGEDVEAPQPLAGPDASAIGDLVRRFLPAYFSASSPEDLSYLVAPGSGVVPPGYGLEPVGAPDAKQLGSGEGPRRTVLATVRVHDPLSGASFRLTYRLEVVRQGRWYVSGVEGALS
jgi:hypothetical protein